VKPGRKQASESSTSTAQSRAWLRSTTLASCAADRWRKDNLCWDTKPSIKSSEGGKCLYLKRVSGE
jgi:hypothetical protein